MRTIQAWLEGYDARMMYQAMSSVAARINASIAGRAARVTLSDTRAKKVTKVYSLLEAMFQEADTDKSGDLSTGELATALQLWYKEGGISRPHKVVLREVEKAMKKCDLDGSGSLDWLEFLALWRSGPEFFRFEVDADLSDDVVTIAAERVHQAAAVWTARLEEAFIEEANALEGGGIDGELGSLDATAADDAMPTPAPQPISPVTKRYQPRHGDWRDSKLGVPQLVSLFRKSYRAATISRSLKAVSLEVQEALRIFDLDGDGSLDWLEFVRMWAAGEPFKLGVAGAVRHRVMRDGWRSVTAVAACVLDEVRGLYDAADVDRGGMLDKEELTEVLRIRYRP